MDAQINKLIKKEQYNLKQSEKKKLLVQILRKQIQNQINESNNMKSFYKEFNFNPADMDLVADIPPLPVTVFKNFNLVTTKNKIVRTLKSSGTSGKSSVINIDKITAFRQINALISILTNHLGKQRRPFLVLDTKEVNNPALQEMTARGAAIRGFMSFSSETFYAFEGSPYDLKLKEKELIDFLKKHENEDILVFGFTYIIWSEVYKKIKKLNINPKNLVVVHGGGWKKLLEEKIEKEEFNDKISELFNTEPSKIIDYYGLVEQTGIVFMDCEYGNKHVPNFADIIIRNVLSYEPVDINQEGLIEIISIIPNSYPGQAIITEDIGKIKGIDTCKCGRKGKYFTFISRVEAAELRGCGDTFKPKVMNK